MKPFAIVTVEKGQEQSRAAKNAQATHRQEAHKASRPEEARPGYREGKKELVITAKRGELFHLCASQSDDYICCNVSVLASVSACPYDCSYCFLQTYLNDGAISQVGETEAMVAEVEEKMARWPGRFFRIGTWSLGDSLAIEPATGGGAELIERFRRLPDCLLELKTKSAHVDSLLDLDHGGRTVISWSLNPERIVRSDELKAASLDERLEAMAKVADAGYLVAAHFDPMILYPGCEEEYDDLAARLFSAAPPSKIAWISLGSLRFNPDMKGVIEQNFPGSRITAPEMVRGPDGKMRYVKPARVALYRRFYQALRRQGGEGPFIYLCMEREDVWEKVFGYSPRSPGHLDYLMTWSLYERYPGLVPTPPDETLYEEAPL